MSSQVKSAEPVGGKTADKVFKGVAYACGILILVVLAAVAVFLLFRAWPLIGGDQQANSETISNFTGGPTWVRCCSVPCSSPRCR